jgi:hypothetical protein
MSGEARGKHKSHPEGTPLDMSYVLLEWAKFSNRHRRSLLLEEITTAGDYNVLFEGLRFFTLLMQCAAHQPDDEAKILAISAAAQFASLFKYTEDLALPFLRISDALRHGAPVIVRKRRRGSPEILDEQAILKGYAAATVDRLITTGVPLKEALTVVAEKLRGVQSCRGPVKRRTIRSWREAVAGGSSPRNA